MANRSCARHSSAMNSRSSASQHLAGRVLRGVHDHRLDPPDQTGRRATRRGPAATFRRGDPRAGSRSGAPARRSPPATGTARDRAASPPRRRPGRAATGTRAAALLILMLTGCHNEVLTLRWEDVDVEHDELRLREAKTGARAVPLSPTARQMLTALPRRPDNPWVIAGRGFRQATGQSERDLAGGSSRGRARGRATP